MSNFIITALTSLTTLRFSGAKSQEFLQGQLTCDMRTLSGHGTYSLAACCDHKGRMVANFWVIRWSDDYLFLLPNNLSDIVKKHLSKFALFSKVIIENDNHFFIAELSNDALGLTTELLNEVLLIKLPTGKRYLIFAEKNSFPEIKINNNEIIWRKNNIADQLAILCHKTSLLFTPQMINLEKLGGVSFTKGCYVGQEIVARTQHLGILKRHLHRLTVSDTALSPGDALKNENGDNIGVVVDAILSDDHTMDVLAVIEDRFTVKID